jgi:hypothetical protein
VRHDLGELVLDGKVDEFWLACNTALLRILGHGGAKEVHYHHGVFAPIVRRKELFWTI